MIMCLRSRKPILQKATPHFPHNVRYWTNEYFVMIYLITHCMLVNHLKSPLFPTSHAPKTPPKHFRSMVASNVCINLNFVAWSCSGGPEVHAHLCRPEENGTF